MKKLSATLILLLIAACGFGQTNTVTPREHFGFDIGEDYHLANYTRTEAYFKLLAETSDRVLLTEIGLTEEGRKQYLMIISSPENLAKISRYKDISQKLARAEGISPEEARHLSAAGKPVVWIDGGLHATETVGSHQLIETYYQLVSRKDPETLRILDNVIILLSQVNPDGQELVADWYMQESDPEKRNMNIPRLYQKYIGHDNNRDFYMMNMKETTHISRIQYIEWMPQIIYNHHQSGPAGTVVAGPPYRDPFNHVFDPMVINGLDAVAAAMINRLNAEDKPGYTRLNGSVYSTWWNGGLRTTPYFHNMIGILTEIIGGPTPSAIPVVATRLVPNNATPNPVRPQPWSFRQSIDYSVSLNYAVLGYASLHGSELLFNIYKMGRNAIEKGSGDHWTLYPRHAAALEKLSGAQAGNPVNVPGSGGLPIALYDSVYKNLSLRDPRGYVIPSDQKDFPTAIAFVNALIKSGILVHRATEAFSAGGAHYPTGSYVVKTDQAFRAHVLDMFEAQDHPQDFQYPGGPPVRPYDVAGWTLAYQMGIRFDRILDGFDGPFERIPYGQLQSPQDTPVSLPKRNYYLLDPGQNNTFATVNLLLQAGVPVRRVTQGTETVPAGAFWVSGKARPLLEEAIREKGITLLQGQVTPQALVPVSTTRIALFDMYGGSMPSGWVRWLLEQHAFSFELIYPKDIDDGNLHSKYDIILFIGPGIPAKGANTSSGTRRTPAPEEVPEMFRPWLGHLTEEKSIAPLRAFLESGCRIVTVGSSTALAYHLGLPVQNGLTELTPSGEAKPLGGNKYFVPGSLLKAHLDKRKPANWGMPEDFTVVFNNSPVFRLEPDAGLKGVEPLAWFPDSPPLQSGWAFGEAYLKNLVIAFQAVVGEGTLLAFGPEITFRAQSHGTFKLLFNALY